MEARLRKREGKERGKQRKVKRAWRRANTVERNEMQRKELRDGKEDVT